MMTWWRHQMVTREFPHSDQWRGALIFDLRLNKRMSKQLWGWKFETPSHPLWHHRNEMCEISMWNNILLELSFCLVMKTVLFRIRRNYSNLNWKSKTIFQLCVLIEYIVLYIPIYTYHTFSNSETEQLSVYDIWGKLKACTNNCIPKRAVENNYSSMTN